MLKQRTIVLFSFLIFFSHFSFAQNTARGIVAENSENKKFEEYNDNPIVLFDSKHSGYITSNIVYSPDGKFVASGGQDRTVRIWSILDKKEVRILKGHTDKITSIAYSSDGKFIASGSDDSTTRIWDIRKGKEIKRFYIRSVEALAYSPDENFIAVGKYNGLVEIWNIQDECKVCTFNTNDECETKINSVLYTPDGKYLVSGAEDGTVVIWNIEKNKQIKKIIYEEPIKNIYYYSLNSCLLINFRFGKSKIWDIKIDDEIKFRKQFDYGVFSIDGKYIVTFNYDDEGTLVNLVELKTGKTVNEWKKNLRFDNSVLSPDGKKIASLIYNSKAKIYTISVFDLSGNLLSEIVVTKDSYLRSFIRNILFCDSDFVFSSNSGSDISIFDIKLGKIKKTLHFNVDDWQGGRNWISPNGKRVFFREHNRFFSINIEKEKIEWSMFYADDASILGFFSNEDKFIISGYDKGECCLFLVDSTTGKILSNYLENQTLNNLYELHSENRYKKYNYDGKYFLIVENHQILVKEASTDKQVCFIDNVDNVDIFDDCIFLGENPYIAVEKGTFIEFWNYYTGKLEYTTILCNKTEIWNYEINKDNLVDTFSLEGWGTNFLIRTDYEYLTYTPEGFFTGTEWAMKNLVHIVDGMDVIGIDQVYDKLYRPDLVAAKMRGEDISEYAKEVNLASIVRSGNAPAVAIENLPELSDSRDVTFDICVQNTGGGIGNVSIVLNGKTIQLSEGVASSKGEQKIFRHTVTLQNGQNKIEAFAMNSAGMIESRRASADVNWQGKTSKPNLYVLTVAVNKYRDKDLWLNYCVPDAASIEESFKKQQSGLYQNVCVYSLKDAEVTKEGLEQKFKELSSIVTADDVFVFFVSGHGTTYDDGDYYFIPVNFRYTNKIDIPLNAISKSDLTKNLSLIKAGKTLMMLDTCNSGAFFADSNKRGMGDKGIFERLSRATGHAILAAASDSQSAMEGYNGHGVFTYVLLDGLAGNADSDGDGFVTLTELSSYVENQVPELSYEKWGYEQVPQKELRRQDFPIAETVLK